MSTIYDNMGNGSEDKSALDEVFGRSANKYEEPVVIKNAGPEMPVQKVIETSPSDLCEYRQQIDMAKNALNLVDDVVLKSYLKRLDSMDIASMPEAEGVDSSIVLFKINRMVYEEDEFATDKFISAISSMSFADCSVFLVIDGYRDKTDFYMGVKNNDSKRTTVSVADTFKSSLVGQFPGIDIEDCSIIDRGKNSSLQEQVLRRISNASSLSSYVGIPAFKDEDGKYDNKNYVQGTEKLAQAMQGKRYTAIILASNLTTDVVTEIRNGYETIYSQLSPMSTQQLAYSTNESLANAINRSKGVTQGKTKTQTIGESHTNGTSNSHSKSDSETKKSKIAVGSSVLGGFLAAVGTGLRITDAGAAIGLPLMAAGGAMSAFGAAGKSKTSGTTDTYGTSQSDTENRSMSDAESHSETFTDSLGKTATIGSSKNYTLTIHNKHIEELMKRIDQELERISMSESTGLWSVASYFFSYDNDFASAESASTIFKSIMQGEESGVETSAINSWIDNSQKMKMLTNSVCRLSHPVFTNNLTVNGESIMVENSSLLSSKELAMLLSLPHKSVPGFPVVEHVSLAKEVIRNNESVMKREVSLGCIFDLGKVHTENHVKLDVKSLTQHVFVTGSTGCGKSETIYKLISETKQVGAKFLVIEPAKGEYKNVFGDVNVFGTNPLIMPLLRINPFSFPTGVHVLEHIDRLTEIFNVCWPMYSAMPAVLKKAMLDAYESCGWDLRLSVNRLSRGEDVYPSFLDLFLSLEKVITESAYSEEVKSNYSGALLTRVESLTNGLNGEIFSVNELSNMVLFDENCIIDLSRVGSQETKSLIMGILIMRLSEYRMTGANTPNSALKHLTVLEEAHNILKRVSTEQSQEGSNMAGKSVEMITNAIAEMRTYGEGFVIVDQSPTSVDKAAIKNTNTKIVMRLPDEDDRKVSGKAAGMNDKQIDEIAKLPTGVAVVYQNDWVSPVLCKIDRMENSRVIFNEQKDSILELNSENDINYIIEFLLAGQTENTQKAFDIIQIEKSVRAFNMPSKVRMALLYTIEEYKKNNHISLWNSVSIYDLSSLLTDLLGIRKEFEKCVRQYCQSKELNNKLTDLVKTRVPLDYVSCRYCLKCLFADFSLHSSANKKMAEEWLINNSK
ncbi:ATP-binding protein [uncultured Prevotella sp.]|uniref:helicase HerA domain-containing protein n=1 Tax=uncultured Prevotella sp. TaxID=159272 RepID=UPI0025D3967E|nr:ATP-binding protein [uncultured Prevotella sp.]